MPHDLEQNYFHNPFEQNNLSVIPLEVSSSSTERNMARWIKKVLGRYEAIPQALNITAV